MKKFLWLPLVLALGLAIAAAPKEIVVGTLYAGSGSFASSSLPEYQGLRFWAEQVNKEGGVFVKAFSKKIPVKLVAYDDQSSATLATTLYNQLITQDHAQVLVSDFGSVLTSVAVPLAQEHKVLLLDPTGTSAGFFKKGDNPYLVLTGLPTSGVWPNVLADFLIKKGITRVAVVYGANDFDQSQAETLKADLVKTGIQPDYYDAVPTSTSNYAVLLHSIAARSPQAVIELGYNNNDIAFLQAVQSSGLHFPMIFTINPGLRAMLFEKAVGTSALKYTFTYVTPPLLSYNRQVNYGPGITAFSKNFEKATSVPVDLSVTAGYSTGLILQKALETASGYTALELRKTMASFSGKLFTLNGLFRIASSGSQVGLSIPLGQFQPKGQGLEVTIVWPKDVATSEAVYPAP